MSLPVLGNKLEAQFHDLEEGWENLLTGVLPKVPQPVESQMKGQWSRFPENN